MITGKKEVVASGGIGQHYHMNLPNHNRDHTEIYSVEEQRWREGTPFPMTNSFPASIPYNDSFLIMGGRNDYCSNKIYKVTIPV